MPNINNIIYQRHFVYDLQMSYDGDVDAFLGPIRVKYVENELKTKRKNPDLFGENCKSLKNIFLKFTHFTSKYVIYKMASVNYIV